MTVVSKVGVSLDAAQLLSAATRKLLKTEVLVGIPDSGAERTPEPGEKKAPSNALIGYVQEFGDEELHIPPRPFLIPGVQDAKDKIAAQLQKAGIAAMSGNDSGIAAGFKAAGLVAQNSVRAKITEGPFVPLAKRTLQARKARGRTGDRPLIDSGQLRASLTYVVTNKGER